MAFDRQGTALALIRICLGVFFFFEGLMKFRWFLNANILAAQLQQWLQASPDGSASRWYLQHFAIPGVPLFARLVPLGELLCGLALIVGFWTPIVAFLAFVMALNYHVASGAIFRSTFLTNGYGLPVLGPTLGLTLGARRLPWSIRN
jgi:uncharacterized membrane protein YphA (DoxX/SURF4 family)